MPRFERWRKIPRAFVPRCPTPEKPRNDLRYRTTRQAHMVVLDANGSAVYNQAGEIGDAGISHILDGLLNRLGK